MKRRFGLIMALILCAALLSVGAFAENDAEPTFVGSAIYGSGGALYANGLSLILKESTTTAGNTVIYIDRDGNGKVDENDIWPSSDMEKLKSGENGNNLYNVTIFGGTRNESYTGDTKITMLGGQVAGIYGGSNSAALNGNTNVTVKGGRVLTLVIGGGERGNVIGNTNVTIGGNAQIGGATLLGVYGGGNEGAVSGTANVTIRGGTISGNVYGGGYSASASRPAVTNKTNVIINGGIISDSVYGNGGGGHTSVTEEIQITITGGTITGKVLRGRVPESGAANATLTVGGGPTIGTDSNGITLHNSSDASNSFEFFEIGNLTGTENRNIKVTFAENSGYYADSNPIVATNASDGDLDHFNFITTGITDTTGLAPSAEVFYVANDSVIRVGTAPGETPVLHITDVDWEEVTYTGSNEFTIDDADFVKGKLVLTDGTVPQLGTDYTLTLTFDTPDVGTGKRVTYTVNWLKDEYKNIDVPEVTANDGVINLGKAEMSFSGNIPVHYGQLLSTIDFSNVDVTWENEILTGKFSVYHILFDDVFDNLRYGIDDIAFMWIGLRFTPDDKNIEAVKYENDDLIQKIDILPSELALSDGATITASLDYGKALSESTMTLNGAVVNSYYADDEVDGTWSWKYPNAVPDRSGDYTAVFTPTNTSRYASLEIDVYVTVNGAPTPTLTPTPTPTPMPEPEELPFIDVSEGDWFYDAVEYVYMNGLMDGVSETLFAPDAPLTRGMVVTILWRMADEPVVNYLLPFDDVASDAWYTEAIRWAASEGIVDGVSETAFAPEENITREQLASILWRYAGEPAGTYSLSVYTDADAISDWAVTAMAWAVGHDLITGVTDDTLVPQGRATRAQCAAILMRFAEE